MNNKQSSSPVFVLTSLSFANSNNKTLPLHNHHHETKRSSSSIAKFDYCLPPDEINNAEQQEGKPLK